MNNDYISKEVEKIIKDESLEYPLNVAMASAWILGNLKGINLKIMEVNEVSSLADYYVMASATNGTQAQAMADEITRRLAKHGVKAISKEGLNEAEWILLDIGDIIVHIFLETARDVYDLDGLFKECPTVTIPQEYYFSSDDDQKTDPEDDRSFF